MVKFHSNLPSGRLCQAGRKARIASLICFRAVHAYCHWLCQTGASFLMPIAASRPEKHDLVNLAREATSVLDALLADATTKVRERVVVGGHVVGRLFDRAQRATHGLAWFATYVEAVRQLAAYAARIADDGALGEVEDLIIRIG